MLLLFGGLGMHMKSLQRYTNLHAVKDAISIPLEVKEIWFRPNFEKIHNQICNRKIAIHCLSAGTFHYTRFLRQFPDIRKNVEVEIFDNPSSFNGLKNRFPRLKNMPPFLFNDMQEQTDYFLMRPLTKAKKMVIVSSNDMISPKKDIDDMIAAWNIQNVWYNDAKHLHSVKTYKSIYKEKIDKIYG